MSPGTSSSGLAFLWYSTPCTNELAQLPTPMIATRTLSSERVLPFVEAISFLSQNLLADGQDSLEHRQPGGYRQQVDEPLQRDTERREDQSARDHDHALGPAADADVSLEPDQLGLRAGVGDEERTGHRGDAEDDGDVIACAREDERDRREHETFADPVRERIEEGAERRRLVALAGERPVEDVEDRPDDEEPGCEPVVEKLVPVLERDHDRGRRAQEHARGGEGVRADARAREAGDVAGGEAPGSVRVPLLDGAERGGSVHGSDRTSLLAGRPSRSRQAVDPCR